MTTPRKRLTLQETLDAARRLADEEMDPILAQSDEEIAKELEAEGIDVKAMTARLQARHQAILQQMGEPAAPGPPPGLPPISGGGDTVTLTRRQGIERFAGGFALAAALALAFFGARSQGWFGTTPTATATPPHGTPADALRDQAFEECGRTHWQKCLDLLDAAKKEDYPGDFEPEVVNARMEAERELAKDGG